MQEDTDMSKAPPHLGAPLSLFDTIHGRNPRSAMLAMISPETQLSFESVATPRFRHARRHSFFMLESTR